MAVDENNEAPIFEIKSVDDIDKIPEQYLRELSKDYFTTITKLEVFLEPLGIKIGGSKFQPNGLGEITVNIKGSL
jgi:hypothetical protein